MSIRCALARRPSCCGNHLVLPHLHGFILTCPWLEPGFGQSAFPDSVLPPAAATRTLLIADARCCGPLPRALVWVCQRLQKMSRGPGGGCTRFAAHGQVCRGIVPAPSPLPQHHLGTSPPTTPPSSPPSFPPCFFQHLPKVAKGRGMGTPAPCGPLHSPPASCSLASGPSLCHLPRFPVTSWLPNPVDFQSFLMYPRCCPKLGSILSLAVHLLDVGISPEVPLSQVVVPFPT